MKELRFKAKDFDGLVEYVTGAKLRSAGVPMDNRFSLAAHVYTAIAERAQEIYDAHTRQRARQTNNDEEDDGC